MKRPQGRPNKYQEVPEFEIDPIQEKRRARQKLWQEKNSEEYKAYQREYQRKYREANREKINQQHKDLYKKNSENPAFRELHSTIHQEYYNKNKNDPSYAAKRREFTRKYYQQKKLNENSKEDLYRSGEDQEESLSECLE